MAEASESVGTYADGRTYQLPQSWKPLNPAVLQIALDRSLSALSTAGTHLTPAVERLRVYYDPRKNYAGALVSTIEPNPEDEITAADLLAVTTLSMEIPAVAVRRLLDPQDEGRRIIRRRLQEIPFGLSITSLDCADPRVTVAKEAMRQLHDEIRTLLATDRRASNRWVFASKLCARKRPSLFPVRDNKVCQYLAGGKLQRGAGMSQFDNDIQVFGYLMSHQQVRDVIASIRSTLESEGALLDRTDLRLLDVTLWTAAQGW